MHIGPETQAPARPMVLIALPKGIGYTAHASARQNPRATRLRCVFQAPNGRLDFRNGAVPELCSTA
jgi:hypothetical protein